MTEILKDCPFCGPSTCVTCQQDEYGYWFVACGACGGSSGIRPPRDTQGREKVVARWNTRHTVEELNSSSIVSGSVDGENKP
jgi:hypothetical protein